MQGICEKGKIHYLEKSKGGPSDARNFAMDNIDMDGEGYVYFADSDDYCDTILLETMHNAMVEDNADVCIVGYTQHRSKDNKEYVYSKKGTITKEEYFESVLESEVIGNYVWNKMFAKRLLKNIRFPVGEIFEDISTVYKVILESSEIAIINRSLYHYVKHNNSLTYAPKDSELLQLYYSVRNRNNEIVQLFPELKDKVILNQIKNSIIIWNRMNEESYKKRIQKFEFVFKEIIDNKHKLRELETKYYILGKFICMMPQLYVHTRFFFRKVWKI